MHICTYKCDTVTGDCGLLPLVNALFIHVVRCQSLADVVKKQQQRRQNVRLHIRSWVPLVAAAQVR